jgi:hypothetical protein
LLGSDADADLTGNYVCAVMDGLGLDTSCLVGDPENVARVGVGNKVSVCRDQWKQICSAIRIHKYSTSDMCREKWIDESRT